MKVLVLVLTVTVITHADNTHDPSVNTTLCTFDHGSCGWTNDAHESSYSTDWIRVIASSYTYGIKQDHTYGTGKGSYMSINPKATTARSVTTNLGRFTSPAFEPANKYCIRFFYSLSGSDAKNLKVYAKEYGGLGYPVLNLAPSNTPKWRFAEVELDSEYTSSRFQIVLEWNLTSYGKYNIHNYHTDYMKMDQKIGVDDVSVSNAGCGSVPICPKSSGVSTEGQTVTCLYFNSTATTWPKAVEACKRLSSFGHLVSIETEDKQKSVVSFIKTNGDSNAASQNGVWTSGTDNDIEGVWVWGNTQQGVTYTDWRPGQPNNVADRQDCLALDYPSDNFSWGDEYCELKKPFICQITYDKSEIDQS